MCRQFKFLLFILAIQRYRSVDCYAPGSLIWSRKLQEFIPITNVSTFGAYEQEIQAISRDKENHEQKILAKSREKENHEQEILARSREKETHNFQGEKLKLVYFEDYNMVHFTDGDTNITGVCGEIWNTLADYSNFTLITIKVDKLRPWQGSGQLSVLEMIHQKQAQIVPRMAFSSFYSDVLDYTTPIWKTRYRIYIVPERKTDTNWIFNVFERKVWLAILISFLLLSVLGYLTQNISNKVSGDKVLCHNLHDHLFYTFATLCSQGFVPDTLDRRSKIFGLSKKIFAWLLLIVLSSHVISYMTNVKLHPPFEDLESLLNKSSYNITMHINSIAAEQYVKLANNLSENRVSYLTRVWWMSGPQKMLYKELCAVPKEALFELEDTKQAFGDRFCELVAIGKPYFPTWVTFGVSKGFKYKRTFDIGILKMKEFGLIDRLKKRWLKTSERIDHSEHLDHATFTPVTLDQVFMLFMILGIGIVVSAIIFVLEVIVSVYKSNQTRTVDGNILIGRASLNAPRPPTDNCINNRVRREIGRAGVRRMPIYVQNVFVVGPNCSIARDNIRPRRTFYN